MTKPIINSHEDLMAEKARLKNSLKQHKQNMKASFAGIKEELSPITQVAKTTKDIFNADSHNPLLAMGIGKITDLVIRKGILRRAGWLPRLIAPVVVQKISTYLVAQKGGGKIAEILHHTAEFLREDKPSQKKMRSSDKYMVKK